MRVVAVNDLEGLVSFPSFHVAGALMVTWAFRRHRWWLMTLIAINIGLVLSTIMTGAHYVIDVIGGAAMVAGCVAAYSAWGRPWLHGRRRTLGKGPGRWCVRLMGPCDSGCCGARRSVRRSFQNAQHIGEVVGPAVVSTAARPVFSNADRQSRVRDTVGVAP